MVHFLHGRAHFRKRPGPCRQWFISCMGRLHSQKRPGPCRQWFISCMGRIHAGDIDWGDDSGEPAAAFPVSIAEVVMVPVTWINGCRDVTGNGTSDAGNYPLPCLVGCWLDSAGNETDGSGNGLTDYRKTDTSLPAMQLPIPEIRRCRNRQLRFLAMCESLPAIARLLNGRTEKRPVAGNDRRFRKWHVPLPAIGSSVCRCLAAGIRQRTTACERCSKAAHPT